MMDPFQIVLDQLRSRYDVLRRLGHDGSCQVYAVRGRGSDRHYSVKVMSDSGMRDARPGALHVSHAHTVRPLNHPKVMKLHAIHHLQGGAIAIAMEHRRERTLAERIDECGPLPATEVERVLRDVAEALAYLHGRGVVHRGLRPESIFVESVDGAAKLGHFGIVPCADEPSALAESRARLQAFAYLAPEQIDGTNRVDDRRVSRRSDLYSLGLVGYAMLSGGPPWQSDTLGELLGRRRTEPLRPLSQFRADVPAHLLDAIERCLESNPRRRWSDAREFIAALDGTGATARTAIPIDMTAVRERIGDGASVLRRAIGSRIRRPRRRRVALAVGGVVIGGLAANILRGNEGAVVGPPDAAPAIAAATERNPNTTESDRPEDAGPDPNTPVPTDRSAATEQFSGAGTVVVGSPTSVRAPSAVRAVVPPAETQLIEDRPAVATRPTGTAYRSTTVETALLGEPVEPRPVPTLLGEPTESTGRGP